MALKPGCRGAVLCGTQVPLFTPMTPPQRSQLCTALKPLHVKAGTCIVKVGDAGNTFYVVEAGTCLVKSAAGQVRNPRESFSECANFD